MACRHCQQPSESTTTHNRQHTTQGIMDTEQQQQVSGLAGLPSRGVMGVVEGWRAVPSGPGPAYICCQQPPPQVVVRNPSVRLVDLYKLSARKRAGNTTAGAAGATAAAAAAGATGNKRPGGQLQQEAAKRQQQQQQQQGLQGAAGDLLLPSKQQHQQGLAGAKATTLQPQQQQQQQRGVAPLASLPNATNAPPAAAAAAAGAGVSASKQLLQYTPEQMLQFSNKRLSELLKGCGLKVAGRKEELVRRLMEHQRRLRKAAQGSSSGGGAGAGAAAAAARVARA